MFSPVVLAKARTNNPRLRVCEERRPLCINDGFHGMDPVSRSYALACTGRRGEHESAFSRLNSPELCSICVPPLGEEAQGTPGARCTRGLVCSLRYERNAHEHTGEAEASGIPCAVALRFISRSPRGAVLCCPRRLCDAKHHRKLDASLRAPGPRDFAVRETCPSSFGPLASTASRLTFGDDRPNAPLEASRDARERASDLPDAASAKSATVWHDGQFAHDVHARIARRRTTILLGIPGRRVSYVRA